MPFPVEPALLSVEGLSVAFGSAHVVENLSFAVHAGRTLAIVGESGSGKSITALSIMRLAEGLGATMASGRIRFSGRDGAVDLLDLPQKQMRGIRGKDVAMIFQVV